MSVTMTECATAQCSRVSKTMGLCEMHYHAEYRSRVGHWIDCERCGSKAMKPTKKARFCSRSCAQSARDRTGMRVRSTALSEAVRSGDSKQIIAAVKDRSTRDGDCWIWDGPLNTSGYAAASAAGRRVAIHRLVLEAKVGRALGRMQAHHVCARAACVNPKHLIPATQSENIAEMHARVSFEGRIAELELALRQLDPEHPLL